MTLLCPLNSPRRRLRRAGAIRIAVALLLAGILPPGVAAADGSPNPAAATPAPARSSNWAADSELDGIVDLLDPDYLKRPINVARLPLKYAVKTVHGRGERVVYSFEDPSCSYCRELTLRLAAIGNLTVHTFMVTFLGDESKAKADAVWCAADRSAAWRRVMTRQPVAAALPPCEAPKAEAMKLVGMLGITLTPTLFFADGSRMNGIRPRAEIEARLRAATRRP